MKRWLATGLVLMFTLACLVTPVRGQSQSPTRVSAGTAGGAMLRPGHWNWVRLTFQHEADQPLEADAQVTLAGQQRIRFSKPIWLGPRSQYRCFMPIRLLDAGPSGNERGRGLGTAAGESGADARALDGEIRLLAKSESGQTIVADSPLLFPLDNSRVVVTLLSGGSEDSLDSQLVGAAQQRSVAGKRQLSIRPDSAPRLAAAWNWIDLLIVTNLHERLDPVVVDAVIGYVQGGGHVWLMLDRVSDDVLAQLSPLLGGISVVDRTTLTSARLHWREHRTSQVEHWHRDLTDPQPLARVLPGQSNVVHQIDIQGQAWPAALTHPAGDGGQVLVTTLGAAGWLNRQGELHADLLPSLRRALTPGDTSADQVIAQSPDVAEMASQQIGYQIMDRGPVALILLGYVAVMGIVGLVSAVNHRLDRMLWVGPLLSLIVAALLVTIGLASQRQAPPVAAAVHLVRTAHGLPGALHDMRLILFPGAQAMNRAAPGAMAGSALWLSAAEHNRRTLTHRWDQHERSVWPDADLAPGLLHQASLRGVHRWAGGPLEATVTFGRQGAVVSLGQTLPQTTAQRYGTDLVQMVSQSQIAGSVLVTQRGVTALEPTDPQAGDQGAAGANGASEADAAAVQGAAGEADRRRSWARWMAAPHAMIGGGRYVRAAVLGQSQRRVGELAASWYASRPPLQGHQAQLVMFPQRMPSPAVLPERLDRRAIDMMIVGLSYPRVAPSTPISVPAAFLPFRLLRGQGKGYLSTVYDPADRAFIGQINHSGTMLFAFDVPESVRPMSVSEATLDLNLEAPRRLIEVLVPVAGSPDGDRMEVVWQQQSLIRPVRVDLPGRPLVDGAFLVAVRIGSSSGGLLGNESEALTASNPWEMRDIALTVRGVTQQEGASGSPVTTGHGVTNRRTTGQVNAAGPGGDRLGPSLRMTRGTDARAYP